MCYAEIIWSLKHHLFSFIKCRRDSLVTRSAVLLSNPIFQKIILLSESCYSVFKYFYTTLNYHRYWPLGLCLISFQVKWKTDKTVQRCPKTINLFLRYCPKREIVVPMEQVFAVEMIRAKTGSLQYTLCQVSTCSVDFSVLLEMYFQEANLKKVIGSDSVVLWFDLFISDCLSNGIW